MYYKFALMIIIFLGLLFGIHYFLYFSTVFFFSISKKLSIDITLVIFFLLSISFIVSSLLARFSDFILVRWLYFFSAFWAGFAIYLVLAFVLAFIMHQIKSDIRLILGVLAYVFAFIYSIYGVWNALNPVITKIDVQIAGLPDNWDGKQVVQLSDFHLGRIHGVNFAEKIINQVNSLKPELVLITGDLFDGSGSDIEKFIPIIDKIESAKGQYFVLGNHEAYLGNKNVLEKINENGLKILNDEIVDVDGLEIIGIKYPEFGKAEDRSNLIAELENHYPDKPVILLKHTPTSIRQIKKSSSDQHSDTYWSPDLNFDLAKLSGVNLQLSGHTHHGQMFPFALVTKWIYNGYDYGLNTEGDFNIYTSSGVGTWGPPIRTGSVSEIVLITLHKK